MPKNSAAPSPKNSPNCSARPRAPRPPRAAGRAGCIRESMRTPIGRRRLLQYAAAGLSVAAVPRAALAQTAVQPPPKRAAPDEYSVTAPVSIEVNARPLPSFDTRDRSRVRFGELEYRSGLILTSRFRGFGGLSGLRLDAKGERFIAISDKGSWFTGRIVYKGREMTGLDEVEASPMLGPDGKPITARGWFDTESIALDADGNSMGCLIGGKTLGQFGVRRTENVDSSDAVLLPSGELLLLERKF